MRYLGAAAVFLLAAGLIGSLGVLSLPTAQPVEPLAPAPPPAPDFRGWPPFVITWDVDGPDPGRGEAPIGTLAWRPCEVLESAPCRVRLSWEAWNRWSLAVTAETFGASAPMQVSLGPLQYAALDGTVVEVQDGGKTPTLDVCHDLALRAPADPRIEVKEEAHDPRHGRSVARISTPEGDSVTCLGSAGLPLRFVKAGLSWRATDLALRAPTPEELGVPVVVGEVPVELPPEDPDQAAWLAALVGAVSDQPRIEDGAVWFSVDLDPAAGPPWSTSGDRGSLRAWVADQTPDGLRQRRVAEYLVVQESLDPVAVSLVIDDRRVWLALDSSPSEPVIREADLFWLGEVAALLAGRDQRYPP